MESYRSKDFEAMKAEKLAIQPRLSCQYSENKLMGLPSSVYIKAYLLSTSFLISITHQKFFRVD